LFSYPKDGRTVVLNFYPSIFVRFLSENFMLRLQKQQECPFSTESSDHPGGFSEPLASFAAVCQLSPAAESAGGFTLRRSSISHQIDGLSRLENGPPTKPGDSTVEQIDATRARVISSATQVGPLD
jgi:hypothetical protein